MCALAKHTNVAVKASGMPSLSTEPYPFRDLHPHIRTLVDAFGPRRTFWGTDLTRMPCTYYECIALFTEHLPWLTGENLEWVRFIDDWTVARFAPAALRDERGPGGSTGWSSRARSRPGDRTAAASRPRLCSTSATGATVARP